MTTIIRMSVLKGGAGGGTNALRQVCEATTHGPTRIKNLERESARYGEPNRSYER